MVYEVDRPGIVAGRAREYRASCLAARNRRPPVVCAYNVGMLLYRSDSIAPSTMLMRRAPRAASPVSCVT